MTQVQRKARVVQIILNNESLDFVNIEQQEAGLIPFGVDFKNPNFARVAEAMGAKGIRLEEPGDVKDALAEALAHSGRAGRGGRRRRSVCAFAAVARALSTRPKATPEHGQASAVRPAWTP
jgi:hypothetical protein